MSESPLRKCNGIGCRKLVRATYCDKHRKNRDRELERNRGNAHQRGYNRRWRTASKLFLAQPENALCRYCGEKGRIQASECVDHRTPHNGDAVLFWDQSNWVPSCIRCNSRKGNRVPT